jgi:hypothetical protein
VLALGYGMIFLIIGAGLCSCIVAFIIACYFVRAHHRKQGELTIGAVAAVTGISVAAIAGALLTAGVASKYLGYF